MYFFLKEPNSEKETIINFIYHLKNEGNFKRSTYLKINPSDWDFKNRMPLTKRGAAGIPLKRVSAKLMDRVKFIEKLSDHHNVQETKLTKQILAQEYDKKFNAHQFKLRNGTGQKHLYLTDFVDDFISRAPQLINRTTNKKYSPSKIKRYKTVNNRIKEYEVEKGNRILIDSFDLKLYDDFVIHMLDDKKYAVNTVGDFVKNIVVFLRRAEFEEYPVHKDYQKKEFAVIEEESLSIAIDENEIETIFKHEFKNKYLSNCRDIAIIGFWTGLRAGDLLELPEIKSSDLFIEVQPNKTLNSSGLKVVIPIHHHIKSVIEKRGMPYFISDQKFNSYIKLVCKECGLTEMTEGSLMDPNKKRKKRGLYPKYKLVSSHTCRRSFATNVYKTGFSPLSIMQITGHKTLNNFLKYIKVTPKEHAQRLLDHWYDYYGVQPNDNNNDLKRYDQLKRLKELLDCGVLTKKEFEKEKRRVLN